jgi:hypothetical protein
LLRIASHTSPVLASRAPGWTLPAGSEVRARDGPPRGTGAADSDDRRGEGSGTEAEPTGNDSKGLTGSEGRATEGMLSGIECRGGADDNKLGSHAAAAANGLAAALLSPPLLLWASAPRGCEPIVGCCCRGEGVGGGLGTLGAAF